MAQSERSALLAFVHRLLLHSSLTRDEQGAVLDLPSQAVHAGKRDLIAPGQIVDHATLVVDGLLARFDVMRDGARQITALHLPGDMCDLPSVVAPGTGWGIAALTSSTVLQVAHCDLRQVIAAWPNLALAFWRDTVIDASIMAKWIANLGRKDARARIAYLLCEVGMRMQQAGLGGRDRFDVAVTQEQIGDATGLTPVHVNRTLQSLRHEGLLEMAGRRVRIPDWERLAALGEFRPAVEQQLESAA